MIDYDIKFGPWIISFFIQIISYIKEDSPHSQSQQNLNSYYHFLIFSLLSFLHSFTKLALAPCEWKIFKRVFGCTGIHVYLFFIKSVILLCDIVIPWFFPQAFIHKKHLHHLVKSTFSQFSIRFKFKNWVNCILRIFVASYIVWSRP